MAACTAGGGVEPPRIVAFPYALITGLIPRLS